MNKNTLDILREEIVIPEVVQEKANDAFYAIRREAKSSRAGMEKRKTGMKTISLHSRKKHRKKILVTACAAALAVCTVTAGAAAYMKWSSGLESSFRVTEKQKEMAEDSGLASFPGMSATNDGVTVTAQTCIVNSDFAFLAFKVEGYTVEPGEEPGFDSFSAEVEGESLSGGGSFYNGLVVGEDGRAARADGGEIALDEDGNMLLDYTQEDGTLEYQLTLAGNEHVGSLLNKPIHVELTDLGTYTEKAGNVSNGVEGTWEFDWTLEGDDSAYTAECKTPLGDTGATVVSAEISPISIKVVYDFPRQEVTETGYHESQEEVDGEMVQKSEPFEYTYYKEPPAFAGVKLKDGTLLLYITAGGGRMGYVDEDSDQYETAVAFDRIVDVDEVQSLLFIKDYPEGENALTEENLYAVDIR